MKKSERKVKMRRKPLRLSRSLAPIIRNQASQQVEQSAH
jgi:hypothetical protein